MSFRLLRLAPIAILLLLAGCSSRILVCPVPAILADTQSVTIFRPGTTPDLANELYTVSLVNATNDCTYSARDGVVRASLELTFRATRSPTNEAATYSVPYFVAVNEGAKIYSKRLYNLKFTFAPGAAVATVTQAPDDRESASQPSAEIQSQRKTWARCSRRRRPTYAPGRNTSGNASTKAQPK